MNSEATIAKGFKITSEISSKKDRGANWWLIGLLALSLTHFLVDWLATIINPLWTYLEDRFDQPEGGLLWVYVVWAFATSFSQLLFGYIGDRVSLKWTLWGGPLTALLCLSCVGFVGSPLVLASLLVISGLAIAAFHPEGAAVAGGLHPERRSRVMAIFALSGYIGQSIGPNYSGWIATRWGIEALVYTLAWGLPMLGVLALGLRGFSAGAEASGVSKPSESSGNLEVPTTSGQQHVLGLLLAIGVLRILPALGVPLALAYQWGGEDRDPASIGLVQSAFMAGIGIGGMICAGLVRPQYERRLIWVMPLLAAPFLMLLTIASMWWTHFCVAMAGIMLGVTMPVFISFGQQLLPDHRRVANALTMGVSWGISGAIVATLLRVFQEIDAVNAIYGAFALSAIASSVLCRYLPRVAR